MMQGQYSRENDPMPILAMRQNLLAGGERWRAQTMKTAAVETSQSGCTARGNSTENANEPSTREKLMEAALKLFVEKGIAVSTNAITKKAGVSAGLLFHYFPTKEDLILELHAKVLDGFYRANYRHELLKASEKERVADMMRDQVEDSWNWCLDNWEKVQYMELVRGAAIANQVLSEASSQIAHQHDLALEFMETIRKRVHLRDLPNDLILDIMSNNIVIASHYMHDHPELRYDSTFRDNAWGHYWNSITVVE